MPNRPQMRLPARDRIATQCFRRQCTRTAAQQALSGRDWTSRVNSPYGHPIARLSFVELRSASTDGGLDHFYAEVVHKLAQKQTNGLARRIGGREPQGVICLQTMSLGQDSRREIVWRQGIHSGLEVRRSTSGRSRGPLQPASDCLLIRHLRLGCQSALGTGIVSGVSRGRAELNVTTRCGLLGPGQHLRSAQHDGLT